MESRPVDILNSLDIFDIPDSLDILDSLHIFDSLDILDSFEILDSLNSLEILDRPPFVNRYDILPVLVESTSEYRNLATYENFDHFSMDEALNFVQSLSGQSDNSHDVDIWTNVVKEQHVKYLNGTFYFTPRESETPSSSYV